MTRVPDRPSRLAHPLAVALCAFLAFEACAQTPAGSADRPPAEGTRTIILVRHGVYDEDDPRDPEIGRALTAQGEEQARLTGARLAKLRVRPTALYASTMTRARQTAEIIGQALGMKPAVSKDLRECTPPTVRDDVMARQKPGEPDSCRAAIERAWSLYFRPTRGRDSTVVIVAHGNVIRYLVSRAVGLDPALWLNMTIANCSLSTVQVRPRGRVRLVAYDDVGHLPLELLEYPPSQYDPGPRPKAR